MSVWYLELDDEITDAVARVRAAKDDRVVLVVPPGSRIGTGRINFRLLAREAEGRGLGIALVSGDAQVRALAASAGLATYATVSATETVPAADLIPRDPVTSPPTGTSAGPGPTTSTAPGPHVPAVAATPGGAAAITAPAIHARSAPAPRTRSVPRRAKIAAGTTAVAVLLSGGVLYGAYVTIPRATIWLTQTAHTVPPQRLSLHVRADEATDPGTGTVRGTWLPVSVTQDGTVTATGTGDTLVDRAQGTVTFSNHSVNPIPVPDLTTVRTLSGIQFLTQGLVKVPANGTLDVPVRAALAGTVGNVDPGTITQMPDGLKQDLNGGTVVNKAATQGGISETQPIITEDDYQTAFQDLQTQLQAQLREAANAPPDLAVDGVVYLDTLEVDQPSTTPSETQVVGQPVPSMSITGSLGGRVLTASLGDIKATAARMLQLGDPGTTFVTGSIVVEPGPATVSADGVSYAATATGSAYDVALDQAALKHQVLGKTVSEAHGILDRYGEVTIQLSPDFMPSLPDDPNRIDLRFTSIKTPVPGTPAP